MDHVRATAANSAGAAGVLREVVETADYLDAVETDWAEQAPPTWEEFVHLVQTREVTRVY